MSARENDTSRVRYLWKSLFATVVALQRDALLLQMLIFETGTATLIRITALAALIAATPATAGNLTLRLKETVLACHSSDTLEKITDIRTSGDKDEPLAIKTPSCGDFVRTASLQAWIKTSRGRVPDGRSCGTESTCLVWVAGHDETLRF